MRRVLVVAMSSLAIAAAACGGGSTPGGTAGSTTSPAGGGTTPSASSGGSTQGELVLDDNVFVPAQFTIASGTEITLVNRGSAEHNFSVEGQDVDHDVEPGETEVEDLELAPGTYTMFCKYHRASGMEGTLTVSG